MAGAGLASNLAITAGAQGSQLFGQGEGIQSTLTPFFQSELYNPQGLGAQTLSSMMTEEGQDVAGALGGARQTATNLASRTGNLAAIPSIIRSADKAGINQLSDLTSRLGIENAMAKMGQQSAGAAGLSGMMGEDISGSIGMYGQENQAIRNLIEASQSGFMGSLSKSLGGMLPGAAGTVASDIGSGAIGW